jgi:hypothetical protein
MAEPKELQGIKKVLEQKNLEYPLNNPDDYKGRVIFNVMKEPETDLGNVLGLVVDTAKALAQRESLLNVAGENPEDQQKAIESAKGQSPGTQTITKRKPLATLGRQVSLYIPAGLQFRDNVAYDNMQIGGMGAAAEAGLQSGKGAVNALLEQTGKTLGSAFVGAANADVAKLATVKIMSRFPDEVAGAFRSAGQVTTNPNTRVLFKEVALREFAFAFKFIATSPKEAEEIKEIIKLFRTELYPENITVPLVGAGSEISVGYRFPNKFQINLEYDGEEIATRIKPCYLRDVNVTYNNTAMAMHSDGNFQEIEMSLSFQETRTLNRKDVEEDGF